MKKKIIIGVVILVIVAIVVGIVTIKNKNKATDNETTKIKMNEVTRSVFYSPQYVAINNGYFKDYGIEIDLTTGQRSRCSNDISIIRGITNRICRTRSINICI